MRNLKINQRLVHYAKYIESKPILDEYGNTTLEVENVYGEPITIMVNYSSNTGQLATETFGNLTDYSRVISLVGNKCPFSEGDVMWIEVATTEKPNYMVKRIADSLNSYLIAIEEIA